MANAGNVSFEKTPYGGHLTLSTQCIKMWLIEIIVILNASNCKISSWFRCAKFLPATSRKAPFLLPTLFFPFFSWNYTFSKSFKRFEGFIISKNGNQWITTANDYLYQKVGDPKDAIRKMIRNLFKLLTKIYPASKLFNYVMEGLPSKNSKTRMGMISCLLVKWCSVESC